MPSGARARREKHRLLMQEDRKQKKQKQAPLCAVTDGASQRATVPPCAVPASSSSSSSPSHHSSSPAAGESSSSLVLGSPSTPSSRQRLSASFSPPSTIAPSDPQVMMRACIGALQRRLAAATKQPPTPKPLSDLKTKRAIEHRLADADAECARILRACYGVQSLVAAAASLEAEEEEEEEEEEEKEQHGGVPVTQFCDSDTEDEPEIDDEEVQPARDVLQQSDPSTIRDSNAVNQSETKEPQSSTGAATSSTPPSSSSWTLIPTPTPTSSGGPSDSLLSSMSSVSVPVCFSSSPIAPCFSVIMACSTAEAAASSSSLSSFSSSSSKADDCLPSHIIGPRTSLPPSNPLPRTGLSSWPRKKAAELLAEERLSAVLDSRSISLNSWHEVHMSGAVKGTTVRSWFSVSLVFALNVCPIQQTRRLWVPFGVHEQRLRNG